jgi:hypothetical protein
LTPFDLTPTYRNIHNKFSLKYYLNLVLVDEEDRRYFKQQEIALWRRESEAKASDRNHTRFEGERKETKKKGADEGKKDEDSDQEY